MVYPMRRPRASPLRGVSPGARFAAIHRAVESLDLTAEQRAKKPGSVVHELAGPILTKVAPLAGAAMFG